MHQVFQPEHIDRFKEKYPDGKIISHPESSFEVCQKSDYVGSTEYIIKTIRDSEPDSRWLVGTELNLVNRLHEECKSRASRCTSCHRRCACVPPCSGSILSTCSGRWKTCLMANRSTRSRCRKQEAALARAALKRMLEVSP